MQEFSAAEANSLSRLLISRGLLSEEKAGTVAHALVDVRESVDRVYSELLPAILGEPEAEKSMLEAGLWPSVSGKGRVRSSPYSAKRGDRDAYPTNDDDTGLGPVHATVLKERLAACPTACGGRDPRSGQENRGLHPAGGRFG